MRMRFRSHRQWISFGFISIERTFCSASEAEVETSFKNMHCASSTSDFQIAAIECKRAPVNVCHVLCMVFRVLFGLCIYMFETETEPK